MASLPVSLTSIWPSMAIASACGAGTSVSGPRRRPNQKGPGPSMTTMLTSSAMTIEPRAGRDCAGVPKHRRYRCPSVPRCRLTWTGDVSWSQIPMAVRHSLDTAVASQLDLGQQVRGSQPLRRVRPSTCLLTSLNAALVAFGSNQAQIRVQNAAPVPCRRPRVVSWIQGAAPSEVARMRAPLNSDLLEAAAIFLRPTGPSESAHGQPWFRRAVSPACYGVPSAADPDAPMLHLRSCAWPR